MDKEFERQWLQSLHMLRMKKKQASPHHSRRLGSLCGHDLLHCSFNSARLGHTQLSYHGRQAEVFGQGSPLPLPLSAPLPWVALS